MAIELLALWNAPSAGPCWGALVVRMLIRDEDYIMRLSRELRMKFEHPGLRWRGRFARF